NRFGTDALRHGGGGQRQGAAARHARATHTAVASPDASGVRSGPQQGGERVGVATEASRGVHPRRGPLLGRAAGGEAESQGCAAGLAVVRCRYPSTRTCSLTVVGASSGISGRN